MKLSKYNNSLLLKDLFCKILVIMIITSLFFSFWKDRNWNISLRNTHYYLLFSLFKKRLYFIFYSRKKISDPSDYLFIIQWIFRTFLASLAEPNRIKHEFAESISVRFVSIDEKSSRVSRSKLDLNEDLGVFHFRLLLLNNQLGNFKNFWDIWSNLVLFNFLKLINKSSSCQKVNN